MQAIHEYWVADGNNETSAGGVPMVQTAFMSAWNWDARPFPVFPALSNVWGDAGNWRAGQWIDGKGPFLAPLVPDGPPAPGPYATFPAVPTLGWSVRYSPIFSTSSAPHVSGRESRAAKFVSGLWEIELNYDVLRMTSLNTELQQIIGFFETCGGEGASFYFEPPTLSPMTGQALGTGDGATTALPFSVSIGGYALVPASVGPVTAVYLDGVVQSGGFTVDTTALAPSLTFATAPGPGVAVAADFHWSLLCRFDDDAQKSRGIHGRTLRIALTQTAHGAIMSSSAFAAQRARAWLVAAQEAGIRDPNCLACLRPRSARPVDELSAL